ncbi:MAG TPA: bifunctional phosphopantothenoylcysteine decarboxylase/phosphopantothenate--cysteine ligase CoaBC [Bryobacteraceae bacterium]|nr:bifunctional phosphopantothenoylcysteine decarboxylase/phosphopantothenate--cysteine ligase CoaBC [Bryobacteraceae bacterium]
MNAALGVGGGIAAYRSAELARALMERGMRVSVVMTRAAQEFITPLTFAALTGRKVITGLFDSTTPDATLASSVEHIAVARESDVLVIAPATADLIARMAAGIADDFLTTMYLAFTGPVVLAPAMNTSMWEHPATRANIETLRRRGHVVVGPGDGLLACGEVGPGRMAEPPAIADAVVAVLQPKRRDLEGETFLITAGPTQEPLDPVRYISNRSSGRMGYALAEAAAARGAKVTLIAGPVQLTDPPGVAVERVHTAVEMHDAVIRHLAASTVIVKAAAVADYHVANVPQQKLKKTAARLSVELDPTPDILAEVGTRKGDRLLIGFAAETDRLVDEARRKLATKHCDMVVGNLVGRDGTGFDAEDNEVTLVLSTGEVMPVERASKRAIADRILDEAMRLRLALHAAQH